jgi:hypothetical protein
MTRDPRITGGDPSDDAAIGQLVRDVAEGWTVPPVRLDAPGWRERVRSPRTRRIASLRGGLGRAGQAATAAIALTVAGALIAVIITRPPQQPGSSTEPSTGTTPGASAGANPSPLPKLFVDGEVPEPTGILVQVEPGDFARVDLAKGVVGSAVTGAQFGSGISVRKDGSIVCLCLTQFGSADGMPTDVSVDYRRFDEAGAMVASERIETITGAPDPRDAGTSVLDRPSHVLTSMGYSADGRYGFVGWSKRVPPIWQSGIIVVDLDDGTVAGNLALPDAGTGEGQARHLTDAPHVIGAGSGTQLLVARPWYDLEPVTSQNPSFKFDAEVFTATFGEGRWSNLTAVPDGAGCGENVTRGGTIAGGGTWIACERGGGSTTVIRRFDPNGSKVDDIQVLGIGGIGGIDGDLTAVSPDGTSLFAWNPVAAVLTRVDLASGESTTAQGPTKAALERGPLAALGDWLAPTAAAKTFLLGGMVVSPDGSRVYALGIGNPASERDSGGSTGIYAFDAAAMTSLGRWQPTADFVSLAVSRDGRFVYAAGLPGVDASGKSQTQQAASITVFDASDGSLRLIAGALGRGTITFNSSVFD